MPLSKAEKEGILNRLRAEYDVLLPDDSPFNSDNTIAIFERKLNRLKSQATGDRPEVEKENDIRDTEWRIAELRKPNWKNRSRSFAENTKMDVEQIVCDGLNRNVKDQDKRYKRYRESYGLTFEELAAVIGVHRKNITRLETPKYSSEGNVTSTVDPFYLETLALIYYVDPYTLLGLKPALISPLSYERTTHADYIMNTLTAYPNDQMEKYLQAFKKIAMLTIDQFDALSDLVEHIPAFKRIGSSQARINHTPRFLQKPSLYHLRSDNSDSPEYKQAELIQAVFCELKALSIKNPKTLRQLAVWASGGANILDTLYALLILGEFPERKDSVRSFASDEEYGHLTPHQIALKRRAANALQDTTASQKDPTIQEHTEQATKTE